MSKSANSDACPCPTTQWHTLTRGEAGDYHVAVAVRDGAGLGSFDSEAAGEVG